MKSKGWKVTWTQTPQSQELSESFCWQLNSVSTKTRLLSLFVPLDLSIMPRLRQGVCGREGKETRSVKHQDGSVIAGHLAPGCAACEWHEMNLQRAVWISCPLSSLWWPAQSLPADNETAGWLVHRDIPCHAWFSNFFSSLSYFFHSFPSNLMLQIKFNLIRRIIHLINLIFNMQAQAFIKGVLGGMVMSYCTINSWMEMCVIKGWNFQSKGRGRGIWVLAKHLW